MSDAVIQELGSIKDSTAREDGYHLEAFVVHLQTKSRPAGQRVVGLGTAIVQANVS
jgi:hypothetical protein